MTNESKKAIFAELVKAFVSEDNRAKNKAREIEEHFVGLYDDDEDMDDFQYALAMYDGSVENHKALMSECRWFLNHKYGDL